MRHYYTAEEFNNNNKDLLLKDKYYDKWSRDCTNELFRQFGHKLKKQIISLTENPNQTLQDGDIYYDMMATETDFSRIAIECKYRFLTSYETHFIELNKYKLFEIRYKLDIIQGGQIFTFYLDGKLYINNVFSDHTIETKQQNKTTNANNLTDGKKEDNIGCYYEPQKIFYFVYKYDGYTRRYIPIFSEEPINILELEDKYNEYNSTPLF